MGHSTKSNALEASKFPLQNAFSDGHVSNSKNASDCNDTDGNQNKLDEGNASVVKNLMPTTTDTHCSPPCRALTLMKQSTTHIKRTIINMIQKQLFILHKTLCINWFF